MYPSAPHAPTQGGKVRGRRVLHCGRGTRIHSCGRSSRPGGRRCVPWARLFITAKITGRSRSAAVGIAESWALMPPSPTSATNGPVQATPSAHRGRPPQAREAHGRRAPGVTEPPGRGQVSSTGRLRSCSTRRRSPAQRRRAARPARSARMRSGRSGICTSCGEGRDPARTRSERLPAMRRARSPGRCRLARWRLPDRLRDAGQGRTCVGHDADLDGVVSADLAASMSIWISRARWDLPRVPRIPAARVGLGESGPDGEHDVGACGRTPLVNSRPQNPGMPRTSGCSSGRVPLAISE